MPRSVAGDDSAPIPDSNGGQDDHHSQDGDAGYSVHGGGSEAAPVQMEDHDKSVTSDAYAQTTATDTQKPADLEGAVIGQDGKVVANDGSDKTIGQLVEGEADKLQGKECNADGEVISSSGEPVGKAEPLQDQAEQPEPKDEEAYKKLLGATVEADGRVVNSETTVGSVVEGDAEELQGNRVGGNGTIRDFDGNPVGKAEPREDTEAVTEAEEEKQTETGEVPKDEEAYKKLAGGTVEASGRVTNNGKLVGVVVEGHAQDLEGSRVGDDGTIRDFNGNPVGKAEPREEEEVAEPEAEEEQPDRSILEGKRVNKAGNVVDDSGAIFGRVVEGDVSSIAGRMCDKDGNVRSESGAIVGKAEVLSSDERQGSKEGPFAELECTVGKEGKVVTSSGDVVGRVVSGDATALFGRVVDQDGDILDRNGNVIGKAERWEEPAEPEKPKGPLAGRKVNRQGEVADDDGNVIGRLVSGDLATCAGKEVDDDGDVTNSKGGTVGHVSLLEDIPPPETESAEDREEREKAERDRELAGKLAASIEQSLDKLRPILKLITDKIDTAERTPKEELDEEQLVREVKPLIEEGGKILTETNGMIRGMDPDGRIQRNAKHKTSTREASPEEHHLAEMIKEVRVECPINGIAAVLS